MIQGGVWGRMEDQAALELPLDWGGQGRLLRGAIIWMEFLGESELAQLREGCCSFASCMERAVLPLSHHMKTTGWSVGVLETR